MGMGYAACKVTVLDEKYAETFPEWCSLASWLRDDLHDFASLISTDSEPDAEYDDWTPEDFAKANDMYEKFREAFTKRHPGLAVCLGYHDRSLEGDRYDDIDGYYFEVIGFWVVSPEGEKIKEHVSDRGFVQFG
jgi:hypothetical protein